MSEKATIPTKVDVVEGRVGYRLQTTESIYTTFGAGFDFKNRNPGDEGDIYGDIPYAERKDKRAEDIRGGIADNV